MTAAATRPWRLRRAPSVTSQSRMVPSDLLSYRELPSLELLAWRMASQRDRLQTFGVLRRCTANAEWVTRAIQRRS